MLRSYRVIKIKKRLSKHVDLWKTYLSDCMMHFLTLSEFCCSTGYTAFLSPHNAIYLYFHITHKMLFISA